jgi:hypothetical protein
MILLLTAGVFAFSESNVTIESSEVTESVDSFGETTTENESSTSVCNSDNLGKIYCKDKQTLMTCKKIVSKEGEESYTYYKWVASKCKHRCESGRCVAGSGDISSNIYVKAYLSPAKQISKADDWTTYELIVMDRHLVKTCGVNEKCLQADYKYNLNIITEEDMEVDLNQEQITLNAGEKKEIEVSAKTSKQGAHKFIMEVVGEDTKTKAIGVLVIGGEKIPYPREDASYFIGDGFALNEDESQGYLVDLKILKNNAQSNNLKGKMIFDNRVFKIQGNVDDNNVEFIIYYPDSESSIGEFSGEIEKFNDFLLLKGDLNFETESSELEGTNFKLTATAKRTNLVKEVVATKIKQATKAKIRETIALKEKGEIEYEKTTDSKTEDKEVYIRPVKVKNPKILYVIPNPWGRRKLELEVIKGDKVEKQEIKENARGEIEGYSLEVGSLENEEDIELSVEKVEKA